MDSIRTCFPGEWCSRIPITLLPKEDGNFEISDVPPGKYILSAWHPGVNKFIEQQVTVESKGSSKADFVFESPKGRRSVHEIEENPRFGLELLGEGVEIKPTIRLQKP